MAWLLSIVIRFALSRQREYLADAGSVELTKNPDAMISALRKIEGRGELEGATSAVMEMCVDNPREGFADLFATHPSVESRIAALVQFAGGHDPGPLALPEPQNRRKDAAAGRGTSSPAPGAERPNRRSRSCPSEPPVTLGGRRTGRARQHDAAVPGARRAATDRRRPRAFAVEKRGKCPPPGCEQYELPARSAMFPSQR